jgi:hypothetical protein
MGGGAGPLGAGAFPFVGSGAYRRRLNTSIAPPMYPVL